METENKYIHPSPFEKKNMKGLGVAKEKHVRHVSSKL